MVSQRRIGGLLGVAESSQRYGSWKNDELLRTKLVEAARERPWWGYRAIAVEAGRKRHTREPQEGVLGVPGSRVVDLAEQRKGLLRADFVRPMVTGANQEWALDFVNDAA